MDIPALPVILIFLSYREDFFGNRFLNFGMVAPGRLARGAMTESTP
jgi:hypothetical protein